MGCRSWPLCLLAATMVVACDVGPISPPPSYVDGGLPVDFYRLCVANRCEDFVWEIGEYEPVSTWHAKEMGIGLIGELVVLSTVDEHAGPESPRPDCYEITIIADKEAAVVLELQVELLRDAGGLDTVSVKAEGWHTSRFVYRAPSTSEEMRFSLEKRGAGRATLYMLEIDGVYGCSDDAVTIGP